MQRKQKEIENEYIVKIFTIEMNERKVIMQRKQKNKIGNVLQE